MRSRPVPVRESAITTAKDIVKLPEKPDINTHVYAQYTVEVDEREAFERVWKSRVC